MQAIDKPLNILSNCYHLCANDIIRCRASTPPYPIPYSIWGSIALPRMNLTELGVKKLTFARYLASPTFAHLTPEQRARTKQIDVFDDPARGGVPGLFLRMSSGGAKAWRIVWYPKGGKGKARTHGLKRYPIYSVAKAREEAKRFLADPDLALKEELQDDFNSVWEQFLKRHVIARGLRSRTQMQGIIELHVLPEWKHKRFTEIRRGDVARLLDKIEDRSTAKQSDAVLSILRKVCRWFQSRNENYTSPIVPGMNKTNPLDSQRKRILNDDELRMLWTVTAKMPKYGALVRLILLTAQRRTKVSTIKRTDIKGDIWTIDTAAREKNNVGRIKLPTLALDILKAQPRLNSTDYVFPAGRGKGPFNGFAPAFEELTERMREQLPDLQPFVLHDLRRTARSLMSRAGVRPDIAERAIGHRVGTSVEQTYDRHDYEKETDQAFEMLSSLVATILNPASAPNVVPLRG
jgi:integrase